MGSNALADATGPGLADTSVGAGGAPRGNPAAHPGGGFWSDPPGSDATGDPLAAFRDGLNGLTSDWGIGGAGPSATLLSNGFNADAGVAQLVSALASLVDSNGAFNATPFAASSDPSSQGVIAAALR